MKTIINQIRHLKRSLVFGIGIQKKCLVERYGSEYGGWSICPMTLSRKSIVYSFGVGEDVSFDLSLIARFGLSVFAFDPTPKSIQWVQSQVFPLEFKFFEYGLAAYNGMAEFYPPENPAHVSYSTLSRTQSAPAEVMSPVYRLSSIMEQLSHQSVDLLKMDIEGSEYEVIADFAKSNVYIGQLLVEFHHRFVPNGQVRTKQAIKTLNNIGFKIFHVSASGNEVSFINTRNG